MSGLQCIVSDLSILQVRYARKSVDANTDGAALSAYVNRQVDVRLLIALKAIGEDNATAITRSGSPRGMKAM